MFLEVSDICLGYSLSTLFEAMRCSQDVSVRYDGASAVVLVRLLVPPTSGLALPLAEAEIKPEVQESSFRNTFQYGTIDC